MTAEVDAAFADPRLVPLYDAECTWGPDDDFFLAFAGTPARVLDLGCGTGRVTVALAAAGHTVTGVDPSPAMLAAARAKPGAEAVTWAEGTSADLPANAFDVAVMTGHVAQVFVTDEAWARVLADLARALVPGGRLAFDTRDPDDRAWQRWHGWVTTLPTGEVVRTEVTAVEGGSVTFVRGFGLPGGEVPSESTLRFRTEGEVRASLAAAGFDVAEVLPGYAGGRDGELVVSALRRA